MMAINNKPKRVFEVWKGNNKFVCGGRLILGPDASRLFVSSFLIGAPALAFCLQMFLKGKDESKCYIIAAIGLVLTILDLTFLYMTSGRDPGIIPRKSRHPEPDYGSVRNTHYMIPKVKHVSINGYTVKVKFCDACLVYRPPRTSHCSVCDNCVQRFDHHCPWIGQCIGLRNYRFFYMFILTGTILCLFVEVFSWINLIYDRIGTLKAMTRDILSIILVVYCFIIFWFVGGLTIFHLYLISTNQTTYENFRYQHDKKDNPYNKGILRNFIEILFTQVPPSINNFRETVSEEEQLPNEGIDASFMMDFSSMEIFDIEFGNIYDDDYEEDDDKFPKILQNLSYDYVDEDFMVADPYAIDAEPRMLHNNSVAEYEFSGEIMHQRSSSFSISEPSRPKHRHSRRWSW